MKFIIVQFIFFVLSKILNSTIRKHEKFTSHHLKKNELNNEKNKSGNYLDIIEDNLKKKKYVSFRDSGDNTLEMIKRNYQGYLGNCLIKHRGRIIDLYPISEEDWGFFIKYKEYFIDFDFCRDIISYENKKGLVVDRFKNILYAGSVKNEKYWYFVPTSAKISRYSNLNKNLNKDSYMENNDNDSLKDNQHNVTNLSMIKRNYGVNDKNKDELYNIFLVLPKGETCISDSNYSYVTAFKLVCKENQNKPILYNPNDFDPEQCVNILEIHTNLVCVKNANTFLIWYDKLILDKYLISAIFTFVGGFLAFASDLNRKKSLVVSIAFSFLFILTILDFKPYVVFGSVTGLSACVILLYEKNEILYYISGALMTFLFGNIFFINTARNLSEKFKEDLSLDHYMIIVFMICFITIFSLMNLMENNLLYGYLLNVTFGSNLIIRGISIIFKGYPDEHYVYLLIKHEEYNEYDRVFNGKGNLYFFGFIFLSVFASLSQSFVIIPMVEKIQKYNESIREKESKGNESLTEKEKLEKNKIEGRNEYLIENIHDNSTKENIRLLKENNENNNFNDSKNSKKIRNFYDDSNALGFNMNNSEDMKNARCGENKENEGYFINFSGDNSKKKEKNSKN